MFYFRYNNNLYDTENGNQILAVKRMVDKITGFSIWALHLLYTHTNFYINTSWPADNQDISRHMCT